jgi:predicted secreted protein
MKKITIMTCLLLGLLLVAWLAWPGKTVVQMHDYGKEIRVHTGAVIELALKEQAGTGYTWEFDLMDKNHFQVVRTETKRLAPQPPVGGPMLRVWQLKALEPGGATLRLDYLRPWEGRAKAVKHFEIKVNIQ